MTFIDTTALRTVDILNRHAGSQDADTGLYISGVATIQSDVVCDIQPIEKGRGGNIMQSSTGEDVVAEYLMFTQTRLTGDIVTFLTVKDQADNAEYEIIGVDDLRDHWEFSLRREDRDGT